MCQHFAYSKPAPSWKKFIEKTGDTVFRLYNFNITLKQRQHSNCSKNVFRGYVMPSSVSWPVRMSYI